MRRPSSTVDPRVDEQRNTDPPDSDSVRTLIRQGRIEAALGEVHGGGATERQLTEELRTYQAELLLQNDQLRAAEQAAAAALEHFRLLFRLHPEPVLQLDAKGQIVDCNEAAARLFGIGSLDGVHLFFSQRVAPEHRGIVLRALSDACRGGQQQVSQLALITPAGETRACWDLRMCGVPEGGAGLPQCVAVLIDQSRMLLRQDELQKRVDEQTRRLGEVHAQAMAASASHAQIALRLVGELQQPLDRVTRYARSLRDAAAPRTDGTQRAQLDGIIEGTNAMLRIVADLGQAVQAESGQLTPRLVRCDLGYLLREAVHAERGAAPSGIGLSLEGPAETVMVPADPAMVEHLLRALLRRAAQYAAPGSTVSVAWGVRPADEQTPARVQVSITRPGPRRAPAELARVFSLFTAPSNPTQGESPPRDHLAMLGVRVMVELHGGRVWAANVDGGVAARFWLPLGS